MVSRRAPRGCASGHCPVMLTGKGDRRLWLFASAAIIYSTISFVEAYGLWNDWKWMKWFAVLSGAIYLPAELGAVLYRFSWEKLIVFGVNTFVVAFIFFRLLSQR